MTKENPFTNREITAMFETIKGLLEAHTLVHNDIVTAVGEVDTKVGYTNGKVGELIKWRERINGGAIVAGAFMTVIVIPILGWCVYSLVKLPETIHNSVEEALSVYEVPN